MAALDLWPSEGSIYGLLDVAELENRNRIEEEFKQENGITIQVSLIRLDGQPLNNRDYVDPNKMKLSAYFLKNNEPWLGMDVDKRNNIHMHLASGEQIFKDHIPIEGSYTTSEWVSKVFDTAKDVIEWKFPGIEIKDTHGFVGSIGFRSKEQ